MLMFVLEVSEHVKCSVGLRHLSGQHHEKIKKISMTIYEYEKSILTTHVKDVIFNHATQNNVDIKHTSE